MLKSEENAAKLHKAYNVGLVFKVSLYCSFGFADPSLETSKT